MIETEASREIAAIKEMKKRTTALTERMDGDFKKFRGDPFEMPKAEGKWENVTSNRDQAEGWKMINILASARKRIYIAPEQEEDEKNRTNIARTEMVSNGLLYSMDISKSGLPDPPLQSMMAFYRVVRGWGSYRLLVMEDDDGLPYLDLVTWDTRNLNWSAGKSKLLKVAYERYDTEASVKSEYDGWNGKADSNGLVCIYDVWDYDKNAMEAVIVGTDYVKEPVDVKLGGKKLNYLPIRIAPGGTVPLVKDDNEDNIRLVGESYLVNNRNLSDIESRLLTYNLTRAGMDAKAPIVVIYDSAIGDLPPEFKKDPYIKGSFIFLDKAKGQQLGANMPMSPGNNINLMLAQVQGMKSQGGLNRVAFGELDVSMTAYGTDILNRNTREHIWPFKLVMEQDYTWMASEIANQYKMGSYKKAEFTGIDAKFKRFRAKIKPSDVITNREFKCDLLMDELRDRATNSGIAIQEVKAGITSKREVLEKLQLSEDPDRTLELIAQEKAEEAFDTPLIKGYLALVEDYAKSPDLDKKVELDHAKKKLVLLLQQGNQPEQPGGGQVLTGDTPILSANRNRMTARTAQPTIPGPIKEAVRNARPQ